MAHVNRIKMLPQYIHNHVCNKLYGVLSQPHYKSSPLAPKISYQILITDMLMEVTWGKRNYRRAIGMYFHIVFNITYFFHQLGKLLYTV